jgi:hypothetical protein
MTSLMWLFAAGFALGFYVALLIVAIVYGNDSINNAFPNPWRLLTAVPAFTVLVGYWRLFCSGGAS